MNRAVSSVSPIEVGFWLVVIVITPEHTRGAARLRTLWPPRVGRTYIPAL